MIRIYEWYIDVFFMVNFLMDAAGLFAAGILCNRKIRLGRILSVCAGATACSILFLLYLPAYLLYLLAVHVLLNPLMVYLCYRPGSRWDFLRSLLAVYLVLFLAGGVQQSLRLYGLDAAWQILFAGLLAVGMFLVWEVRRRVLTYVCPVELEFFGERITVTAFCDSGNLLHDPETGREVSVLRRNALPKSWLFLEAEGSVQECLPDNGNRSFMGEPLRRKSRRIPYRTIGVDGGELEVITLDKMRICRKGRVREIEKPVFGLFDGTLPEYPRVELLLNSAYV